MIINILNSKYCIFYIYIKIPHINFFIFQFYNSLLGLCIVGKKCLGFKGIKRLILIKFRLSITNYHATYCNT
jgi:hypothetical protein